MHIVMLYSVPLQWYVYAYCYAGQCSLVVI
jgi:hypothetical protein